MTFLKKKKKYGTYGVNIKRHQKAKYYKVEKVEITEKTCKWRIKKCVLSTEFGRCGTQKDKKIQKFHDATYFEKEKNNFSGKKM